MLKLVLCIIGAGLTLALEAAPVFAQEPASVRFDSTFWDAWHTVEPGMPRADVAAVLDPPDQPYAFFCDSLQHLRGPGEGYCAYANRYFGFEAWTWKTQAEDDSRCVDAYVFVGSKEPADRAAWQVIGKATVPCGAIY